MKMLCPLRKKTAPAGLTLFEEFLDCYKERCGLWSETYKCCSLNKLMRGGENSGGDNTITFKN